MADGWVLGQATMDVFIYNCRLPSSDLETLVKEGIHALSLLSALAD